MAKDKILSLHIRALKYDTGKHLPDALKVAGNTVVNDANSRFRKETDIENKKWKPRKNDGPKDKGRGILVGDRSKRTKNQKRNTKRLSDSVKVLEDRKNSIVVGSLNDYASYHNEGQGQVKRSFLGDSKRVMNMISKDVNAFLKRKFKPHTK